MAIARIVSTSFGNTNSFAISGEGSLDNIFSDVRANTKFSTKDSNVGTITLRGTRPINWPLPPYQYAVPIFQFAITPTQFKFSGLNDNYEELSRPNREPLLYRASQNLLKVDFTALIGDTTGLGTRSCEPQMTALRALSRLQMSYTLAGSGPFIRAQQWAITGVDLSSLRMNPLQQVTLAEANFTLTALPSDTTYRIPGMIAIKDIPPPVAPAAGSGLRTNTGDREVWSKIPR